MDEADLSALIEAAWERRDGLSPATGGEIACQRCAPPAYVTRRVMSLYG